jgi:hypothetical protein
VALDAKKTKETDRPRYLSIVYFVEAGKTRNLKIPVKMLYWGLGSLGLLVFWSVLSIFLVSSSSSQLAETEGQLTSSLEAIFAYQTQYENVYELAYQATTLDTENNEKSSGLSGASEVKESPSLPILAGEDKNATPEERSVASVSQTTSSSGGEDPILLQEAKEQHPTEPAIFVDNFQFKGMHKKFQVDFDIRNSDQSKQAIGSVWAVARIVYDDGTQAYISAPANLKTDEKGVAVNLSSAHKFNLRYFKSKAFVFTPTKSSQTAKVDWVEVSVMDRAGRKKSERFAVETRLKEIEAPTDRKSKTDDGQSDSRPFLPETSGIDSKTQDDYPRPRHAELQTN